MKAKKVLTYVGIAFVVFYLFTQPANAAAAVRSVFDAVTTGAESLSKFFTSLVAQ